MGAMLTQFHLRAQGQSQESYMDGRKEAQAGQAKESQRLLCPYAVYIAEIKQPLQERMIQLLWARPCSFIPPEGQVHAWK